MARSFASSVINAPIEQVWARIRDFNGLPNWSAGVARSEIEDGEPADQVGCVRKFALKDGGSDPRAAARAVRPRPSLQLFDR